MKHSIFFGITISGILLLIASGYFYFLSGKIIYQSETMRMKETEIATTKSFDLKKSGNPYKIRMNISYTITEEPKEDEAELLTYTITMVNAKGKLIAENTDTTLHRVDSGEDAEQPTGKKHTTITLLTLSDLPTDAYAISIIASQPITPDQHITLDTISYEIRSNYQPLHPLFPVMGLLMSVGAGSYLLRQKKRRQTH